MEKGGNGAGVTLGGGIRLEQKGDRGNGMGIDISTPWTRAKKLLILRLMERGPLLARGGEAPCPRVVGIESGGDRKWRG